MNSSEFLNKRLKWYSNIKVQHNIIADTKDRETVFLSKNTESKYNIVRLLRISHTDYLSRMFDQYRLIEDNLNIYVSLAKYRSIPEFDYFLVNRANETREWFRNYATNQIIEYDLLLDFDLDKIQNFHSMKLEAISTAKMLLKEGVKFTIFPSGSGYQIIVYSENFPFSRIFSVSEDKNSFNTRIGYICKNIKNRFRLKFLDTTGIGVYNKIRKCAYSLVNDRVILPLPKTEFDTNYNDFDANVVFKNCDLYNRGLKIHNDNITLEQAQKNTMAFLEKYELLEGVF